MAFSGADLVELAKPRITLLVAFTVLVGFVLASPARVAPFSLAMATAGTGLVAAGAGTFNMLIERWTDARMPRTRTRPLPSRRRRSIEALWYGSSLTVLGLAGLFWHSGALAAGLALLTSATYLFAYTPLKPRTSLATLIGAIPGALPPVIGWSAARGSLGQGAFWLFAILFFWQIPHFLAVAFVHRDEYSAGGLPVLPVMDRAGHMAGRQAVAYSAALLMVSLGPVMARMTGTVYLAAATLLGLIMLASALGLALRRSAAAGRLLFRVSLVYLPVLGAFLLCDRQ